MKCNTCPLRTGAAYGYSSCCGNLPADQCAEKLVTILGKMNRDLEYLVRSTDSVYPSCNNSVTEMQKALDLLPIPEKPACLPDGTWDRHVIGHYRSGFHIVVDGKIIPVSGEDAKVLRQYAKHLRRYDAESAKILRGEGIHKEGICPVCGGQYRKQNPDFAPTGGYRHNWRCEGCGASGRTVRDYVFLGHFDLKYGNGEQIETPEKNDHDEYTCPCCGERFEDPDDFSSDGYWRHGAGSYGMKGCGASGRAVYGSTFRYHADIKANRRDPVFK